LDADQFVPQAQIGAVSSFNFINDGGSPKLNTIDEVFGQGPEPSGFYPVLLLLTGFVVWLLARQRKP